MRSTQEKDPSGNIRLGDIGTFLKEQITGYFKTIEMDITLKYIDPSYNIRSMPANAHDSSFCLLMGHNAVHAGMAGRTNTLIGYWKNEFTHVPIRAAVAKRQRIDPNGWLWNSVLACTGQPREMV
jgi:6-phosphofructokinase 1